MQLISPLCGIKPNNNFQYYIDDHLVFCKNDNNINSNSINDRTSFVKSNFSKNLLYRDNQECYYACRITTRSNSHIGLIAKVDLRYIEKNIFRHEQCIESKQEQYTNCFNLHKFQINPVILIHEYKLEIDQFLKNLVSNNPTQIILKSQDTTYEIWTIDVIKSVQKHYDSLDKLMIADGHHRISSILDTKKHHFSSAFLISANQMNSKNIFRKYKNLNSYKLNEYLNYLQKTFIMQEVKNIHTIKKFNYTKVFINRKWYKLITNEKNAGKNNLLNYLNDNINYDESGNINFMNHPITLGHICESITFNTSSDLSIIIPAHEFKEISKPSCYPPHSTWLEPKLPDGLISFAF